MPPLIHDFSILTTESLQITQSTRDSTGIVQHNAPHRLPARPTSFPAAEYASRTQRRVTAPCRLSVRRIPSLRQPQEQSTRSAHGLTPPLYGPLSLLSLSRRLTVQLARSPIYPSPGLVGRYNPPQYLTNPTELGPAVSSAVIHSVRYVSAPARQARG